MQVMHEMKGLDNNILINAIGVVKIYCYYSDILHKDIYVSLNEKKNINYKNLKCVWKDTII